MLEILQRFSAGNMASMLAAVLAGWLVWPVLCGFLGAKRCGAWQGVMHGFLWGPVGLGVVLISKRKCVCPTCGQRTLTTPIDANQPLTPQVDRVARPAFVPVQNEVETPRQLDESLRPPPPPVPERVAAATAPPNLDDLLSEACAGYSEEERERLRSWVVGS